MIDIDRNKIVQEIPTGAEPEGVLLSEDGKVLYVTSEVGDLVHMMDTDSGKVVKDVVVGTRPRRFAATPDGKDLWVTAELSGDVYIVDRAKFTVAGKVEFLPPGMRKTDVTPVGIVMTRDGKTAYVDARSCSACRGGRRARPQGAGLHPGRQARLGRHAVPTISRLFVANGLGDDITVIDTTRPQGDRLRSRSVAYPGASRSMIRVPRIGRAWRHFAQRRLPSSR